MVGPDIGSIISDFVINGDLTFSGSMRTTGGDDDIIGIGWMVQDDANHHRLAWNAFDVNNGYGDSADVNGVTNGPSPGDPTVHGLRVLKESSNTRAYFSQDTPNAMPYTRGLVYDFAVSRVGNNFSVLLTQGVTMVLNISYADSEYSSGRLAFYSDSQLGNQFFNIDIAYSEVPEPGAVAVLEMGALFMAARRRRG